MPPIAIMAGVGLAGSIGGGLIQANAAGHAADAQANAAIQAAQIQAASADKATALQQSMFNTQQGELAPWLAGGQAGLANLEYGLGINPIGNFNYPGMPGQAGQGGQVGQTGQPGQFNAGLATLTNGKGGMPLSGAVAPGSQFGSLMQPFGEQFQAPTGATEQNDPGYQFRLQQGQQALERSATAKGNILNGGTAKAEQRYGQDYASNEYQNVYNRQFNEYATRYNQYQTNQANQYNRFASLAGVGQTAANQLGYLGQGAANSISNLMVGSGNAQASGINNAAYARASGYQNQGAALGGMFSNLGGLAQLYALGRQQPSATTAATPVTMDQLNSGGF